MNIFNLFGSVPAPKLKRNKFNLSHDVKLTTDFGLLTPMMCLNTVPGDTFKFSTETFCRLAPMVSTVMDSINIFNYYFKVPYRLLFEEDDFNQFFVQGDEAYFPKITFTKGEANQYLVPGSLLDYLGYPCINVDEIGNYINAQFDGTIEFSALPLLAYNLVYNEYFRDENLIEEIEIPKYVGRRSATELASLGLLKIRRKAYKKDYFTSALPFTQQGPQATIPLSGEVQIDYINSGKASYINDVNGGTLKPGSSLFTGNKQTDGNLIGTGNNSNGSTSVSIDNSENLRGVIHKGTATINDLRYMTALQRYLESKARGGSRTAEWLLSIYGVRPGDLRLHRPEFIGSMKVPIVISSVDQTSSTDNTSPIAYQAGKGAGFAKGQGSKVFCDEHCLIIGLSVVVPQNTYYQGCDRFLTKFDPYDFFIPQFQGLGEQAVKSGELFFDWKNPSNNNSTFGYQSRYSEYKFMNNSVHGEFRSTMAFQHLARAFENAPALNKQFIEINSNVGDLNRIFAVKLGGNENVTNFSHFWVEFYHHVSAKRPMKFYGIPSVL